MDECPVHMKSKTTQAIQNCGTEGDFILAGYTGRAQVCDKGVNKPFKQAVRSTALQWMMESQENTKPSRVDIVHWIQTAWQQITQQTIQKHLEWDWVAWLMLGDGSWWEGVLGDSTH